MEYINHINQYDNSAAIQAALDAGTLANPYVAMDSAGTLDFNSLQPTPPAPSTIGVWTEPQQNRHVFQILDADPQYWGTDVKIGELLGVYSDGNYGDLDVLLDYTQGAGTWHMIFYAVEASTMPQYDFEEGVPYIWESGAMTDPDESISTIDVDWDGVDSFYIDIAPGFLTTINPPYPAGE